MDTVYISRFCSCGLDLDPIALIYELDLDILKMYLHTKMKFLGEVFQRLEHEQDRQTDRHIDTRTDGRHRTYYQSHICGW